MAKKQENVPRYGTTMRRGIQYYRTRITDADGKRVDLYAETCEELQLKEMEARRQVEEAVFRRKHPTVAEYCEKWLLMQSAKVSSGTLRGYTQTMNNYIVKPLGDMYLEDKRCHHLGVDYRNTIRRLKKSPGKWSGIKRTDRS